MTQCPKCGAEPKPWRSTNPPGQMFVCDTWQPDDGELNQSDTCRIAELEALLLQLDADAQATLEQYNKNGPQWTSRETGNEFFDASYVLESAQRTRDLIAAVQS